MSNEPTIRVDDQLWLSPPVAADRDRCVELLNDPDIERRMRHVPHPYSPADFDHFLTLAQQAYDEHGCPGHLAIRHSMDGRIRIREN